jgi:hypothetical protein
MAIHWARGTSSTTLLCEEHARHRLEEQLGVEEYARDCEEARTYLEAYELPRARAKLIESGGTPRRTEAELRLLEYLRKSAQRFGWTDQPAWVTRLEEWIAKHEA